MPACTNYIKKILPQECIGDSLTTINSNFSALQVVTCELEQRFDRNKQIRTFFYYGPNAAASPTSGMADNSTSRPSDLTIQAFVNSSEQLNLPAISRDGDTAYVVYQKTGFLNSQLQGITNEYNFTNVTTDVVNSFSPILIVWKLTCDKNLYTVDVGFPKFTRASTSNNNFTNWNNPSSWSLF